MPRILLLCLVIVSLSAYGSSSTGLTIVPRAGGASGAAAADDEPNNKRTTRTVAVGGSATGNIETSGDKDWFRVTLASATKYRFDLESEAVNGATALGDPRLVFRNLSATRLGFVNRGGTGNNARLEYAVPTSGAGDYFLVAMGQRNTTGSYRLSVTAIVNRAPQPAGSISGPPLTERGAVWSVDVSGKFTDPDGDTLSYSAASSAIAIATVSASGSTVTITPVAAGTTTVTVTATDPGGLNAAQQISVTVNSSNRAPLPKGNIEPQTLTLGSASKELDVSEKFVDADGDTLSYTAESSDSAIATASASGNPVTITPVAVGATTITVTAKDLGGLTATQEIAVTVRRPNRAPVANGNIGAQTLMLGDADWSTDISGKFSDPDGDTLAYEKTVGSAIVTVRISDRTVTVAPVAAGTTTVTLTATDPDGLSAEQVFSVTVIPQPNRKPILVGSIAPQPLEVGSAAGAVDVSGKFSDPDGDTLSYEVASSNTAIVVASTLNSAVILTPVKRGTVTITVTASDPDGLSAKQIFSASVSNRAPVAIGEIRDKILWVGDVATIRADNKFIDPDGDTLTYEASVSGTNLATPNVSGSTVSFTIVAVGEATFSIKAKDSSGGTATHEFSVTVPNRAPTANGSIGNQRLWIGQTLQVNVSGKFSDLDRHALTYTPVSSRPTVATARPSGGAVTVTPVAVGTTTITVTARDPLGETAIQRFSVTVPNRPPVPNGSIPPQPLTGTASRQINVAGYFRDPDRHALVYTPVSSNTAIATVRPSGSAVIVTPGVKGTATITITARDPFGNTAIQRFSVTVPNRPPAPNSSIPLQRFTGTASRQINLEGYFRDPDRHALVYTPVSSNTAAATVRPSGSAVIITPGVKGTATITITARDPFGSTAIQRFSVTVPNRPPARNNTIGSRMLHATASTQINVAGYFTDPDRQALAYTPVSSNTAIATVRVSGSVVTITPGIKGTTTITVTARDPYGRTAAQSFSVTVPNHPPIQNGTIGNQSLPIGRADTVNVSGKFSDPDRHTLTYQATSSSNAVATARISGNLVILTPVTRGTVTITITARDPFGGTATQRFSVTVPNHPPTAVGRIETQTLTRFSIGPFCYSGYCSRPYTSFYTSVNVSSKFSDPDGDTLTYTATFSGSSSPSVQTLNGNTVRISGSSWFRGTVTVTARDPGGLTATQTFAVKPPNRAPTKVSSISTQWINRALRSTASVNVSSKFSDPDGDTLTYSARSSAANIATASASGNIVTIRAAGNGNATITVTATDPGGLKNTQIIPVRVFHYVALPQPVPCWERPGSNCHIP